MKKKKTVGITGATLSALPTNKLKNNYYPLWPAFNYQEDDDAVCIRTRLRLCAEGTWYVCDVKQDYFKHMPDIPVMLALMDQFVSSVYHHQLMFDPKNGLGLLRDDGTAACSVDIDQCSELERISNQILNR